MTEILCGFLWIFYREKGEETMKIREDKIRNFAKWALIVLILFSTFLLSPYLKYQDASIAGEKAQAALDDRSPKLSGYIDRSFISDEAGTSNSLIFLEMEIGNSGGSPSIADQFDLFLVTTNTTNTADEIYFTNEYGVCYHCGCSDCLHFDLRPAPEKINPNYHENHRSNQRQKLGL